MLDATLALRGQPNVHLAGQITGVEGYIESTGIGLICGLLVLGSLRGSLMPRHRQRRWARCITMSRIRDRRVRPTCR